MGHHDPPRDRRRGTVRTPGSARTRGPSPRAGRTGVGAAVKVVGGSVSERPKERASKAREGSRLRGFKSHRYRH